jgi:integrase/recombinase XerC
MSAKRTIRGSGPRASAKKPSRRRAVGSRKTTKTTALAPVQVEILPPRPAGIVPASEAPLGEKAARVLASRLAGAPATTRRAVVGDLADFAEWAGRGRVELVGVALLLSDRGLVLEAVSHYRAALMDRGLSSATIARRLSTLRSVVAKAHEIGVVDFELPKPKVAAEPRRARPTPTVADVGRVVSSLSATTAPRAIRDLALVRLMAATALRRESVCSLDVRDVDLDRGRVFVRVSKGKRTVETGGEEHSIPSPVVAALRLWKECRDRDGSWVPEAPLFSGFRRGAKGLERLHGRGLARALERLGRRAGVDLQPHGLRRWAVTTGASLGFDLETLRALARHRSVKTTEKAYLERRDSETAASVSEKLGALLG